MKKLFVPEPGHPLSEHVKRYNAAVDAIESAKTSAEREAATNHAHRRSDEFLAAQNARMTH